MENIPNHYTFRMIEPPCKTAKEYFRFVCIGFFTIIMYAVMIFPVICQVEADDPDRVPLTLIAWVGIVFFVLAELGMVYIYVTHVFYYSSDIQIDSTGLQRMDKGEIKERILWSEVAKIYMRKNGNNSQENLIIVTKIPLAKPTKKLFKLRGYFGIRYSKNILLCMSYSKEKEEVLRVFAESKIGLIA